MWVSSLLCFTETKLSNNKKYLQWNKLQKRKTLLSRLAIQRKNSKEIKLNPPALKQIFVYTVMSWDPQTAKIVLLRKNSAHWRNFNTAMSWKVPSQPTYTAVTEGSAILDKDVIALASKSLTAVNLCSLKRHLLCCNFCKNNCWVKSCSQYKNFHFSALILRQTIFPANNSINHWQYRVESLEVALKRSQYQNLR